MIYIIDAYEDYKSQIYTFSTKEAAEAFLVELYGRDGEVSDIWRGEEVDFKVVETATKYVIVEKHE